MPGLSMPSNSQNVARTIQLEMLRALKEMRRFMTFFDLDVAQADHSVRVEKAAKQTHTYRSGWEASSTVLSLELLFIAT